MSKFIVVYHDEKYNHHLKEINASDWVELLYILRLKYSLSLFSISQITCVS